MTFTSILKMTDKLGQISTVLDHGEAVFFLLPPPPLYAKVIQLYISFIIISFKLPAKLLPAELLETWSY